MSKFRGITWNNAMFGPKIQVRRSIDLAELGDLGNITDDPHDLPTSGALHRDWTDSAQSPIDGSKSGTRLYTDLRYVDSNVVDTQDMGLISDTASTHRIWSSTGAITDIVTSAPSTLGNPSSGTTLTGGEAFATGWISTYWATASDSTTSNPQVQIQVNNTTIDSDWETALDNWSTGDSIEIITPTSLAGTTLTATGTGITTSTSGDYTTYYFDVSNAPSSSTYVYKVEHTTSGSSSSSSSTTSTATYSGPALNADYALDFSSTNNYLSVDQTDASGWFSNSSGWSIELWFKHSSSSYHMNDGIVNQHGNIVLINGAGGSSIQWAGYSSSTAGYSLTSTTTISDTDWHHLHIGYDGTTVRMFLDGSLEDSTTTAVYGDNADSDFLIGAREGNVTTGVTNYWNGYIADVHITSGSTASVRTSAFDVDDVYSPELTDNTVLLVYGTSSGIENETSITVTETGSNSAIGYDLAQPWAGYGTSNITYTQSYSWGVNQGQQLYIPRGLVWNDDGTMVYYVSGGAFSNCKVVGASLSTAYDISTITDIDAQVYDAADDFLNVGPVSQHETNLTAVSFNPEGTKMWVVGESYDALVQYNLSTAWDITTASVNYKGTTSVFVGGYGDSSWNWINDGKQSSAYLNLGSFYGMEWHSDGYKFTTTRLDVGGKTTTYTVSTAYDITTITSSATGEAVAYADTDGDGLEDASDTYGLAFASAGAWNHNGTERYTVHQKFDTANYDGSSSGDGNGLNGWDVVLVKATASTPYDPSTLSYSSQCDLTDLTSTSTGPTGFKPNGITWSPNGRKLFIMQWKKENDASGWTNSTAAIHEFASNG